MRKIFLSASVPDPKRNPAFFSTADVTAIRESVRALATFILPNNMLIWGGHPAITPMIRVVADNIGVRVQEHVTLYQSLFFEHIFPEDNDSFANIILTPKLASQNESLEVLRYRMLTEHEFIAGVFIGGMEGVLDEYKMFRFFQPHAEVIPLYSTGGAAQQIFENSESDLPNAFKNDYSYFTLFRRHLRLT